MTTPSDYFRRLNRETQTRLWVNNPTPNEAIAAVALGAVAATSNPTYGANQLKRNRDFALSVVDDAVRAHADDSAAADLAQQRLIQAVMPAFHGLFERSGGREGLVAIQGDPLKETDAHHIVEEALRYRKAGANFISKIPVTEAGLVAIEQVLLEGIPVLATEVFAISQALAVCAVYRRACERSGKRPAFFVTHISGIFDDYLADQAKRRGLTLDAAALSQAGCAVAKAQFAAMRDAGYGDIPILGGGARANRHFTEMVGANAHVTLNYSTIEDILRADPPIAPRIEAQVDAATLTQLSAALPEVRIALDPRGLTPAQFYDFGPVRFFRDYFVDGWKTLLATCAERRKERTWQRASMS